MTDSWTMGWIWNSRSEDIVAMMKREKYRERWNSVNSIGSLLVVEIVDIESYSLTQLSQTVVKSHAGAASTDVQLRQTCVGPTSSVQAPRSLHSEHRAAFLPVRTAAVPHHMHFVSGPRGCGWIISPPTPEHHDNGTPIRAFEERSPAPSGTG